MSIPVTLPAEEISRLSGDTFARSLGAQLLEARPGYACAALTVAQSHTNALGWPHGGVIFTLADFAFAAACNALASPTVAVQIDFSFLSAAQIGEELRAEAILRSQNGRRHLYLLSVRGADQRLIAEGHGLARTIFQKGSDL